jgi:spatacsin
LDSLYVFGFIFDMKIFMTLFFLMNSLYFHASKISQLNYIYRETSSIKVNDIASQIANNVGAAVEAINSLPAGSRVLTVHYNRHNAKRRRLMEPIYVDVLTTYGGPSRSVAQGTVAEDERRVDVRESVNVSSDSDQGPVSLSKMVAVLCEQQLFLPLLRAFEMFLPSCSLLPLIRSLQVCEQIYNPISCPSL